MNSTENYKNCSSRFEKKKLENFNKRNKIEIKDKIEKYNNRLVKAGETMSELEDCSEEMI